MTDKEDVGLRLWKKERERIRQEIEPRNAHAEEYKEIVDFVAAHPGATHHEIGDELYWSVECVNRGYESWSDVVERRYVNGQARFYLFPDKHFKSSIPTA